MIFVNIGILLCFCVLALVSRKNYSKYKTKKFSLPMMCKGIFLSMGETCSRLLLPWLSRERLEEDFRKINVVSAIKLHDLTRDYIQRNATICLFIVFSCNLAMLGSVVLKKQGSGKTANIIEREEYQGNVRNVSLYLTRDDKTEVVELSVYPMEYSKDEFLERVEALQPWIKENMLGHNRELSQITENLELPLADEDHIFTIEWQSSEPEYCTSYGALQLDRLEEYFAEYDTNFEMELTASISYNQYSVSYSYPITISTPDSADIMLDDIREQLMKLESENRGEKLLTLPDTIDGISISTDSNEETSSWLFRIGIIACVFVLCIQKVKRREAIEQRNAQLLMQYPRFVNKLCMLLETGMTIKSCFEQFVYEEQDNSVLKEELAYMLQELSAGGDEAMVYESVGLRLGLPNYLRLMNHISQNLRMGTADLIMMLEDEVRNSLETKREYAKNRGEQASTKLLFPMVILLLVVMVIIVFPAIYSF